LVGPVTLALLWLNFQKSEVRERVKHQILSGIDKEELVLMKFLSDMTEQQVEWEGDDEFEFEGVMYDVVATQIKGDTTYYWCWKDNEETQLARKMDHLLTMATGHDQQSQQNEKLVIHFFKSLFFNKVEQTRFYLLQSDQISFTYAIHYTTIVNTPVAPPPEILS